MALNVLIVDDSSVVRMMIAKMLRMTGLPMGEVHDASNGQEGLEVLERHWIDLVLLDVNMPVMNGQEMIERIRANPTWADLPVVVVSTEGSKTRIEYLEGLGAKFIHKPFSPESIGRAVKEITGVCHEQ